MQICFLHFLSSGQDYSPPVVLRWIMVGLVERDDSMCLLCVGEMIAEPSLPAQHNNSHISDPRPG